MLLGEAIQETLSLERLLTVLGSRLTSSNDSKQGLEPLREEIVSTANRLRDLTVAIGWTEQNVSVSGLPLAAYRTRGSIFLKLSEIFESTDSKESDKYRLQANQDMNLADKAIWFVDLQNPLAEKGEEPEEET